MADKLVYKLVDKFKYDVNHPLLQAHNYKLFRGLHVHNHAQVTVKVVEVKKINSELQLNQLNTELQALQSLRHPHIIKVEQVLKTANNYYIISQFCQQRDFASLFPLPQAQALQIFNKIASACQVVWRAGFILRILNPGSINLKAGQPKICDFGSCQKINSFSPYPMPIYPNQSTAPQTHFQRIFSATSDVWALGLLLYQMLTGSSLSYRPYQQFMKEFKSKGLQHLFLQFSVHTVKLLQSCLKINPAQRISPQELVKVTEEVIKKVDNQKIQPLMKLSPKNIFNKEMTPISPATERISLNNTFHSHKQVPMLITSQSQRYIPEPKLVLTRNHQILNIHSGLLENLIGSLMKCLEYVQINHLSQFISSKLIAVLNKLSSLKILQLQSVMSGCNLLGLEQPWLAQAMLFTERILSSKKQMQFLQNRNQVLSHETDNQFINLFLRTDQPFSSPDVIQTARIILLKGIDESQPSSALRQSLLISLRDIEIVKQNEPRIF